MTYKKSSILKKIVSASMAVLSIMSAGSAAIAADVGNEYDGILASVSTPNYAADEIVEDIDFGAFLPSCTENVKKTYKEKYPEHSDLIDSIVDSIISDDEFIAYFESEGPVAFQIVADALDGSLEPEISLFGFGNESYYSKYSSYSCKQLYSYYDGPSAVVTALMGSGCIDYTHDTAKLQSYQIAAASEMGTNSTNNTLMHKITAYMQKKYAEKFGQNTSGTFQTRVFNKSNSSGILSYIQNSLSWDAEPILKIPDRSVLNNHRNETGSLYVTVRIADDQGQYIVYADPTSDKSSGYSLSYDELKALTDSGNVWLSTCYSKSSNGFPLAAYPADAYVYGKEARSYFTKNGKACAYHKGSSGSNCKYYDGGSQCYGFANYIYYVTTGKNCSESKQTLLNLKGQNASSLKGHLQGLPIGTHLRVRTGNGGQHSMAIMGTTPQGITVYHANYDNCCGVYYDTFTWEEYAERFPDIDYYVAP